MVAPAVRVEGLAEIRKAFRAAGGRTQDLTKAHRKVAKVVERSSRTEARRSTRQQKRAASVLLGGASAVEARLAIRNTKRVPYGKGAFLGGKRPQFDTWVGNNWNLLEGKGPYVIAEAMKRDREDIVGAFAEHVSAVFADYGISVDPA